MAIDPQITEGTLTVRNTPARYQMNLTGTEEALALERELNEALPPFMAEKVAKAIVALVELTTVKYLK